jgi:GH24 family phage-related lysozyme (muramidase)
MTFKLTITSDCYLFHNPDDTASVNQNAFRAKLGQTFPVVAYGLKKNLLKFTLGHDAAGKQLMFGGRNTLFVPIQNVQLYNLTSSPPAFIQLTETFHINAEGLNLLMAAEGLELTAYLCPAGVLTVGYGSTGPHVYPGMRITKEQAVSLLQQDLERFERTVQNGVKVPLTSNQFSALVSFSFNIGTDAFLDSTLLKLLNKKDYAGAAQQFQRWNMGAGVVLPGLTTRRLAEKALFLKLPSNLGVS